jgi:decaprenylphospho-beta-D-erythro-pentofuranosid-2-ulose 2-reductase
MPKQKLSKVMIVGATSAIAYESAKLLAAEKAELFLVARSADKLTAVQNDLKTRGAKRVEAFTLDMNQMDRHQELVDAAYAALGTLDAVLVAHGTLGDQKASERSAQVTIQELTTNALSTISLLTILANCFEQQKSGVIAVISSVAGDRGRGSNYVYGTAKGALNTFLQGLRNRMFKSGVAVLTIKPGFVDTPMTANVKKNPLFAKPESVAKSIVKGMENGRDVLYVPWFWMGIMMLIRNIPEFMFKKLKL